MIRKKYYFLIISMLVCSPIFSFAQSINSATQKGGAGKSTTTINLGTAFQKESKNWDSSKPCCIVTEIDTLKRRITAKSIQQGRRFTFTLDEDIVGSIRKGDSVYAQNNSLRENSAPNEIYIHKIGKKRLKPGFKSLFHGPPGTGK